tara:strand:- start:160 stop:279 length:120 start_codon:yes stop_codon:yes gene_type:complete
MELDVLLSLPGRGQWWDRAEEERRGHVELIGISVSLVFS